MMKLAGRELMPAEIEAPKMTRIFYDYKDFRMRLDDSSPAHYDVELERKDSKGRIWVQWCRIYGTDVQGNLIVFERRWIHSGNLASLRPQMVDRFVATCARPVNAVPGRLEVI